VRRAWWIGMALVVSAHGAPPRAWSQEPPAQGPADVINRAREEAAQKRMRDAAEAGEQAAPEGSAPQDPHTAADSTALRRIMGQGPSLASGRATEGLPAGTVRVRVVDGAGEPLGGIDVRLGVMVAAGGRRAEARKTGEDGVALFEGLPTGGDQSYRASVMHQGAQYAASPFQLPLDRGYDVHLTRLPVTRDPHVLLQLTGQSILELREGRLHVTQQAQLTNLGEETYVFPAEGQEVRLPPGFTAFQSQQGMGDQRLVADEAGFRLHGSLPPGPVSLLWAFDLPVQGTDLHFRVDVPWRTYVYRVVAEAIPGMALEVDGMAPAHTMETETGRLLVTQVERGPADPVLEQVTVHVTGIPGPGPWRWLALGGAAAFLVFGLFLAFRGGRDMGAQARAREERKGQLVAEAVELERLFARGEIGPQYHGRRRDLVLDELAALLKLESAAPGTQPAGPGPDNPPT
jgi:hypothetical protein